MSKLKWNHLWVAPEAHLRSDEVIGSEPDQRRAVIEVTGMLCHGPCVDRPENALKRLPEVIQVDFDVEMDAFTVTYRSNRPMGARCCETILSTVVAPGGRKRLAMWGKRVVDALGIPKNNVEIM